MWKDILVHVDGTGAGRKRVGFSVALAKSFDARLTGLHVKPHPEIPPVYKPRMIAGAIHHAEELLLLDARMSESTFREAVAGSGVETAWHAAEGDIVEHICGYARYADVVVLGQYESAGIAERHPLSLASSIVLRSGRPLLVIPETISGTLEHPRLLVAWDGGAPAVRAMHDALPVLRTARDVVVVSVDPEQQNLTSNPPYKTTLREHLGRHGVTVSKHLAARGLENHAKVIEEHLKPGQFDLLVMGAFDHPAWFELLFGGATQSIMRSSTVPVLVSH